MEKTREQIIAYVEKAESELSELKKNLKIETTSARGERYERLFEKQLYVLAACRCPKEIISGFYGMKHEIVKIASEIDFPKRDDFQEIIPFLPVIPLSYLGIYGLASMLSYSISLNNSATLMKNRVEIPNRLYYVFGVRKEKCFEGDVRTPESLRNMTFNERTKENMFGESCLTYEEGCALLMHNPGRIKKIYCGETWTKVVNEEDWPIEIEINDTYKSVTIGGTRTDNKRYGYSTPTCTKRVFRS